MFIPLDDFAITNLDNFQFLPACRRVYRDDISGLAVRQGAGQGRCPTDAAPLDIGLIDTDNPVDFLRAVGRLHRHGRTEPDMIAVLAQGVDNFRDRSSSG